MLTLVLRRRFTCLHYIVKTVFSANRSLSSTPDGKYAAVVFDMVGVYLPLYNDLLHQFEAKIGLPKGSYLDFIYKHYPGENPLVAQLDTGELYPDEFAEKVAPLLTQETTKQALVKQTVRDFLLVDCYDPRLSTPNPEMVKANEIIRQHNLKTGLITNNYKVPGGTYLPVDVNSFDVVIQSAVEKLRKPQKAVYELLIKRLGVLPEKVIYMDDVGSFLKPAKELGIHTIKVVHPRLALEQLEKLLEFPLNPDSPHV